MLGFPIRKSSNQRPVIDSPRLIADSHVLHRLLMPRHPPCALNNLQNTQIIKKNYSSNNLLSLQSKKPTKNQKMISSSFQKMLASTIQFSNNNPPTPTKTTQTLFPSNAPGKTKTTNNSLQPQNPTMRPIQKKLTTNIPPMSKPSEQHSCPKMAN